MVRDPKTGYQISQYQRDYGSLILDMGADRKPAYAAPAETMSQEVTEWDRYLQTAHWCRDFSWDRYLRLEAVLDKRYEIYCINSPEINQ